MSLSQARWFLNLLQRLWRMKGCLAEQTCVGVRGVPWSAWTRYLTRVRRQRPVAFHWHLGPAEIQTSPQEVSQKPRRLDNGAGFAKPKPGPPGPGARRIGKSHQSDCLCESVSPSQTTRTLKLLTQCLSPLLTIASKKRTTCVFLAQDLQRLAQCLAHSRPFEGMEELLGRKNISFLFRPLVASRCFVLEDAQKIVLLNPNKLPDRTSMCFVLFFKL